MQIGILETGHAPDVLRPELGDYSDLFERLLDGHGFAFRRYDAEAMVFPQNIDECDGWLITGSKHGAYEGHPFIAPLEKLIREIHAAKMPLVGVCFGHQIIAQALGGRVEKFAGGWSIGRQPYHFEGREIALNAWHQDQVTALPPGAEVVASSEKCPNAAILYPGRAYTVQPHPEFRRNYVDSLIQHRAPGVVPQPLIEDAASKLEMPLDSADLGAQFARFFKEGRIA